MKVNKSELHAHFDVDETLIMWGKENHPRAMEILCPYTGETLRLVPHKDHVKILKDQSARGFYVTVWSAGGWRWAETIVKALELEPYVNEVRTKPTKCFDDLPAEDIIGNRVYIPFRGD